MRTACSDSDAATEEIVRWTPSRSLRSMSSRTLLRTRSAKVPAKSAALAASCRRSLRRERYQKAPLSGSTSSAAASVTLNQSERPSAGRSRPRSEEEPWST